MKKVLFLLLMCMPMVVLAQEIGEEEMSPSQQKGDPMLGTKYRVTWISKHAQIDQGQFGPVLILKCEGHIFVNGQTKVGLYNQNDSLVAMSSICLNSKPTQGSQHFLINGPFFSKDSILMGEYSEDRYYVKKSWRLKLKDAIKWVQTEKGAIRIVTPTYGNRLYDIKLRFKEEQ